MCFVLFVLILAIARRFLTITVTVLETLSYPQFHWQQRRHPQLRTNTVMLQPSVCSASPDQSLHTTLGLGSTSACDASLFANAIDIFNRATARFLASFSIVSVFNCMRRFPMISSKSLQLNSQQLADDARAVSWIPASSAREEESE